MPTNPEIQSRINAMFCDVQQQTMRAEYDVIRANPEAHKKTTLFGPGVSARYYYFETVVTKTKRGKLRRRVAHCYSVNRNAAGYFLVWREVTTNKGRYEQVKRSDYSAVKTKRGASGLAQERRKTERAKLAAAKARREARKAKP